MVLSGDRTPRQSGEQLGRGRRNNRITTATNEHRAVGDRVRGLNHARPATDGAHHHLDEGNGDAMHSEVVGSIEHQLVRRPRFEGSGGADTT